MSHRFIPNIVAAGAFAIPLLLVGQAQQLTEAQPYFPSRDSWERKRPSEVGMNDAKVEEAIAWAKQQVPNQFADFRQQEGAMGRIIGPLPDRAGEPAGLVIRKGYIVAEIGNTERVQPSYSVAKSYLATLFGVALDRGLIRSVTDLVRDYVDDGGYDSPHNAKITWEHHLRQSSEWDGTLFGKPSNWMAKDEVGPGYRPFQRTLAEPGAFWEYNDVRVNRFSLSLLRVFKRPLGDVLKTEIMDPIGASTTWQYLGYDNADVVVDGQTMRSVPGGTRWGAGLWMNAFDHARFGYLMLRGGNWNGRQVLPASWIKAEMTPGGPVGPAGDYGYLWFTNAAGGLAYESASAFSAQGDNNTITIDPVRDLVVVWRYANGGAEFTRRMAEAIDGGPSTTAPQAMLGGLPILRQSATVRPVFVKGPTPVAPPGAPESGVVLFEAIFAPSGKAESVRIRRGVHAALDQAIVDAYMQHAYQTLVVNGVAHPFSISGSFDFERAVRARLLQQQQVPR